MSSSSNKSNLLFPDEGPLFSGSSARNKKISSQNKKYWKVAIVDDEEQVHQVTEMVLSDFSFRDRDLKFLHAYSGEEAKELFNEHPDISVLLLDVVMEHDHSGLEFVQYVREEKKNSHVRIVLRTGQPGQAPENDVIAKYDINDYKEKTELTAQKLYTLMFSCLRSYRDIMALERNRKGLEHVISASQDIFSHASITTFAEGVMEQICSLLYADQSAFLCELNGLVTRESPSGISCLAGTGYFTQKKGKALDELLPSELVDRLNDLTDDSGCIEHNGYFISYLSTQDHHRNILAICGVAITRPSERRMLELICQNALIAFDNLNLRVEIEETQRELVYRLGEAVETRSKETGNHVRRVAEISKLLALKSGLSKREAEILKHASPMHDLGKIGIPDSILNKPDKLTEEEWKEMQTHTSLGAKMLGESDREILKLGATISLEHHEKWNGCGYPNGKSGEEISLQSRITAITDVYDALSSARCYKKAWPHDEVLQLIEDEKGKHFDPKLVDIFLENIEEIRTIQRSYPD